MDARTRPVYEEWSPWPGWIQIVFWGAMVLGIVAVVEEPDLDPRARVSVVLALAVLGGLVQWLVAGLSVRLYRDDMKVGIGRAGVVSKRIRYDEIVRTESVRYHPLREFGGWGIRYRGRKRAWTARGNRAVVLHLEDGVELYVGSDRPYALEDRIRTIAGARVGSRPARGGTDARSGDAAS